MKRQQPQPHGSRQRLQKVYIQEEDIKIVPIPGRGSGGFAARDLPAGKVGEELFLDYGDDYWLGKYRRSVSRFFFIEDGEMPRTGCNLSLPAKAQKSGPVKLLCS